MCVCSMASQNDVIPQGPRTRSYWPCLMKPVIMVLKHEAVGRTGLEGLSMAWNRATASSQCPTCSHRRTVAAAGREG